MKAKIKIIAAGVLLVIGFALVLGAAGSCDLGTASINETVIRCVIGIVLLIAGAVLSNEGEKE